MSVTAFPLERRMYLEAVERKRRLWSPPGGRVSSDLEILSDAEARRRRAAVARAEAESRAEEMLLEMQKAYNAAIERAVINMRAQAASKAQPPLIDGETVWPVTVRDIARAAGRVFDISMLDLVSPRRVPRLVRPRHIVMYLAREMTVASLPEIGRLLGGRDHTTVLSGYRKIRRLLPEDEGLAAQVETVRKAALAGRNRRAEQPVTG